MNLSIEPIPEPILLHFKIVSNLEIQPKALAQTKKAGHAKGCISTDCPLAMDDLVDSPRWHSDVFRQPILAHSHRLEEFFKEDFARVYRRKLLFHLIPS